MSLALGIPLGQLGKRLSSAEWAEYQAADNVGLVPDWRRQQEFMAAAAGIDPAEVFADNAQQDMTTLYQQRKAMYGHC